MDKNIKLSRNSSNISLDIKNLYKRYPIGLIKKKAALKGVSFQVMKGEVFGIVGRNGAGKSTLIKAITGLLSVDEGSITVNGYPPVDAESRKFIGYLPESPCLYQNLTVKDHFSFIAKIHGMDRQTALDLGSRLLERVRLQDAQDLPIRKFSKGMVQRAALACALLPDPQILILDEPMSGLDPIGRHLVVDLIRRYHLEGKTILFCSHILTDVERICDRIGIMETGRLKAIIAASELEGSGDSKANGSGSATPLEKFFLDMVTEKAA